MHYSISNLVTMLYIISPEFIYLISSSLYLLIAFTHSLQVPLTLETNNLFYISMKDFFFEIPHIS